MGEEVREWGRLITVVEAERLTGRKRSTWRRDILERKVPIVRIGRQVRIPLAYIEEMVRRGYRPAVVE
jgi:excisionase family DNA binding protein